MNLETAHESSGVGKPPSIDGTGTAGAPRSFRAGPLDRARCVVAYLWGERRTLLAVVVSLTVLTLYLIGHALDWSKLLTWEGLSTVGSVLAIAVGVTIFFSEAVENAEAPAPKRLSVYFLDPSDPDITRLVCQGAYLSGEGDMRQWGQQLGLQICNHKDIRHLDFTPFADLRRLGLEKRDGKLFVHYQAVFRLRSLPPEIQSELDREEVGKGFPMAKVLRPKANDQHGGAEVVPDEAAKYRPVP